MYKILIWGTGKGYDSCIGILKHLESNNDINIVGITSNDNYYVALDDIKFIPKDKINTADYDYVLVTANSAFKEICKEGALYGINKDRFITAEVLWLPDFSFDKYIRLMKSKISIISNNCWGGLTYHYLHLKFFSPFINMAVDGDDYIKLLSDFNGYMSEKLIYYGKGINSIEKFEYPIFLLGDIKLNMIHYHSIEEGEKNWYERIKRINYDNLFIMMYTQSPEIAKNFSSFPFKKKVCFVDFDVIENPSIMTIKPYQCRHDKNKMFWEYVLDIARGRISYYDVWSLLLDGVVKSRIA